MPAMQEQSSLGGPGRREQLLAAAREVLGEHGYERTTVSSIASRASVAQGTFYLYFPSKEALPGALSEQLSEQMGAAADRAAEQPDLPRALESLALESFAVGERFRDILLVANRGLELCADYDAWLALTERWRGGIEGLLRRQQQGGNLSAEVDIPTTAVVVRDLLDRAVKARVLFGQDAYAGAMVAVLGRALAA